LTAKLSIQEISYDVDHRLID